MAQEKKHKNPFYGTRKKKHKNPFYGTGKRKHKNPIMAHEKKTKTHFMAQEQNTKTYFMAHSRFSGHRRCHACKSNTLSDSMSRSCLFFVRRSTVPWLSLPPPRANPARSRDEIDAVGEASPDARPDWEPTMSLHEPYSLSAYIWLMPTTVEIKEKGGN